MRILLYSRVFPPQTGGMERFAADLALWLAQHGHDVTVATMADGDPAEDKELPVLRRPSPLELARAVRRAEVVHINGLSLRGLAAALPARRPVVVTHAGHQAVCPTGLAWSPGGTCTAGPRPGPCSACAAADLQGRAAVRAHRAAAVRLVACNVPVSRYLQARLGLPRSHPIYNPVADRAFAIRADGSEEPVVAFAGRLVEEKGLDVLIDALGLLPDVRLEVAGDGPMRGVWQQRAVQQGVAPRIRWHGRLDFGGVAELYARAAVVCVPSVWQEPFGYAAAEAMAMGCAVVATPNGALPELLADGRGFVAEAATAQALADALRRALSDPAARRAAGEAARRFAHAQLHIDTTGAAYVEVYREVAR